MKNNCKPDSGPSLENLSGTYKTFKVKVSLNLLNQSQQKKIQILKLSHLTITTANFP